MTPPAARPNSARRGRTRATTRTRSSRTITTDLAARLVACQATLPRRLASRGALADLVSATHASLDSRRVAEYLVGWAPDWWPLTIWAVVSSDDEGQMTVLAERGMPDGLASTAQAVAGWVLHSGEAFASGDLRRDHRLPGPLAAVGAVGFVLRGRGRSIGALVGLDRRPSDRDPVFSPKAIGAWDQLIWPGALALENALVIERAEALSVTDDLTRLYNSRYLNQSLRRETKRAVRTGNSLSLLFIDLDGFKAVNDTYGHLSGSRALVEAAAVIRACARETDIVARFGGDEFAVILPETARDGAIMVAERVRDRIAAHSFLAGDLLDVHLTASVGIATLPDVAASAEELVQAADRAMYKVKMAGKNGIQLAVD